MKTFANRLLTLATALTLVGAAHAADRTTAPRQTDRTVLERNLERALNKHLSFPLTITEKTTADVRVSLAIDREGRVKVLECQGNNQMLNDYVVRKLERIDIGENPDGIWKVTHLLIHFRPEKT
ncbi:MAG: hypothetical protein RBT71_08695 [Flavobacteriales bacterium]|jgi:hypothetical protein|nr:hypothetical protein [Flavobacteriales bacterium]